MELKYLHTFKTIVEEGSFTKAAERLNYTQSTITFQVGQLEQELSVKLFERVGRRMMLTKAGEQLCPYVNDVLTSVGRLHCIKSDLAEYKGVLQIGVGETLLCYRLPHILKRFHDHAPNAKLFLRSMNCYDIRNELLNGTLDIGVFYENVGGFGDNLTLSPCGSYTMTLVASPEIKKEYSDFITPNQNIPLPLIINERTCVFRQIFEQYLQKKSIVLDHTIELWSIPTIKNLVKNCVGISYLPTFSVENELNSGELVEIKTELTEARISAVCGYNSSKWVSPAMELFIRLIQSD
jgi:DNA-binding transcriptional LysR family regulator